MAEPQKELNLDIDNSQLSAETGRETCYSAQCNDDPFVGVPISLVLFLSTTMPSNFRSMPRHNLENARPLRVAGAKAPIGNFL